MKWKLYIVSLIFLSACSSAKLLTVTQADADRAATKYPGITVAELNEGKILFEQNCARCHGLKDPASRSEEKWNKVVPKMVKKVNKKIGTEHIDGYKQEQLLKYLITMSSAPKRAKE